MKPILFNTDMVRAIYNGKKTVTRRVVKTKHKDACGFYVTTRKSDGAFMGVYEYDENESMFDNPLEPPYKVNDVLYVRETVWQRIGHYLDVDCETKYVYYDDFLYVATDREPKTSWNYSWVKRPSIHMPKEAARLFLRVTGVRVERLQDITEEQAEAEGIRGYTKDGKLYKYAVNTDWWLNYHYKQRKIFKGSWWQDMPRTAKEAFHHLWNSTLLCKKDTPEWYANNWSGNPYVWVIEFEVITAEQAQGN